MKRQVCHRQTGIATIEFAFVALLAVLIMQFCWWAGRAYWQHSILEAATRDAARLLASVPPGELATSAGFYAARTDADALIEEAARASGMSYDASAIYCDGTAMCSVVGLEVIRVEARATLPESVFWVFGGDGITINVAAEVPYDGRFAFQ